MGGTVVQEQHSFGREIVRSEMSLNLRDECVLKPCFDDGDSHPGVTTGFIVHWEAGHVDVMETPGFFIFPDAQWSKFVVASLVATQGI